MKRINQNSLTTITESYKSTFYHLNTDLQFIERHETWEKDKTLIDAFGRDALLFIANPPTGLISLRTPDGFITNEGPFAVFVPSFSIVEWKVRAGSVTWGAFRTNISHPSIPTRAVCFPWSPEWNIHTTKDIISLFESGIRYTVVEKNETHSPIAMRAKKILDKEFASSLSISDLAKRMANSYSSLAHSFTKCFGLSPQMYRNRLRIFESLTQVMVEGNSAINSAQAAGFSEYVAFYRQFRRIIAASPGDFTWSKDALPENNTGGLINPEVCDKVGRLFKMQR